MRTHVTVVIPARNASTTLAGQLSALAQQDARGPFDVIVVDDGSSDGTVDVAHSFTGLLPSLKVLEGPGAGPGAARNVGVRAAAPGHILFCDADDVVDHSWVRAMSTDLDRADLVGGRVDELVLDEAGERQEPRGSIQDDLTRLVGYLPYSPSCNLGIRSSVFEALHGFDESLTIS